MHVAFIVQIYRKYHTQFVRCKDVDEKTKEKDHETFKSSEHFGLFGQGIFL